MDIREVGTEVTEFLALVAKDHGASAELRCRFWLRKLAIEGSRFRSNSKPLGDGLFELIVSHNRMEYRFVYVFHGGAIVVVSCFVKKTRKTPKHELETARKRHRDLVAGELASGNFAVH
jgi:phage-related protein